MLSACPCTKNMEQGLPLPAGPDAQPVLCQLCRKQHLGFATLSRGNQYAVFSPAVQQAAVPKVLERQASPWEGRTGTGDTGARTGDTGAGTQGSVFKHADAALCSHIPVAGYHPPDGQELFFEDQVLEGVIPAWLQPVE